MTDSPTEPQAAAQGIATVLCDASSRELQAQLFGRCFKKGASADDLTWRYDLSPHGASISLLSQTTEGQPVSGYACSPRRALVRGDESTLAPIGETGDVMTDPDFRKRGLFSALDRGCMEEAQRQGWPMVFGLPNRHSAHIFLELGWEEIGRVRPYDLILHADDEARATRLRRGRLASVLAPASALRTKLARRGLRSAAGSQYQVQPLLRFPEEIVQVAQRVEASYPLMIRRDADYLNWRFIQTPTKLHASFGVYTQKMQPRGYCVVQMPRPGSQTGYLVDVLGVDDSAVAAAIEAGITRLEREGASVIAATAIVGSFWERWLLRAGFTAGPAKAEMIVIRYVLDPEHPLVTTASDASQWYLTDGDRDDETMG